MYSIGIDSGSIFTKGALIYKDTIVDKAIVSTGWRPKLSCESILNNFIKKHNLKLNEVPIVVTGYGRISVDFADKAVTEITCHGRGAFFLNNKARVVIDIGGQDSKVIKLDEYGNISDFVMNDKCAAGTGRFLQVMSGLLDIDIDKIDEITNGVTPKKINSMCTVFAESEVIGMLASGTSKEAIASGILYSISDKIKSLSSKLHIENDIIFTGGLAKSKVLKDIISNQLDKKVISSDYPQLNGAIGASIIGKNIKKYK